MPSLHLGNHVASVALIVLGLAVASGLECVPNVPTPSSAILLTGTSNLRWNISYPPIFNSNDFTTEFWFISDSSGTMLRWRRWGFYYFLDGGTVFAAVLNLNVTKVLNSTQNNLADYHWHHFALTFNSTHMCLYIDGKLDNWNTTGFNIDYSFRDDAIVIGSDGNNGGNPKFVGGIANLRQWDHARSAPAIHAYMYTTITQPMPGLLLSVLFNETATPNFKDYSGLGWDVTPANAIAAATSNCTSISGTCDYNTLCSNGENCATCLDCTCSCGDGICTGNENGTTCSLDCVDFANPSTPPPIPSPTPSPPTDNPTKPPTDAPTPSPTFLPSPSPSATSPPTLSPTPPPTSCNTMNGGCDFRVSCDERSGEISCGDCEAVSGLYGDPRQGCKMFCGDKTCNETYENCVNCPSDCGSGSCNVCGDLICDTARGESCKNCVEDCGVCKRPQVCTQACNGHGKCVNGLCVCDGMWTGPSCDLKQNEPITTSVNKTSPNITIGVPGANSNTKFSISIKKLAEINSENTEVRSYDVSTLQFSLSQTTQESNEYYNYTYTLENGAFLVVLIIDFRAQYTLLEFANTTQNFTQNSFKLAVSVFNWPFRALSNSLSITFDSNANLANKDCVISDTNANLRWFVVVANGYALYGKFEDKALVDGRIRTIFFSSADTTFTARIPHFWYSAEMDPNFSVLIEDNHSISCHKKKNNTLLIIEIVVPIVVFLILLIIFYFCFYSRLKTWTKTRKLKRITSDGGTSLNSKEVEIEKIDQMEIHSSAGHFVTHF